MIWESRFCMPTICINSFPNRFCRGTKALNFFPSRFCRGTKAPNYFPNRFCRGTKPTLLLFSSFFPPAETYSPKNKSLYYDVYYSIFRNSYHPLTALIGSPLKSTPTPPVVPSQFRDQHFMAQLRIGLLRRKKNSNQNRKLTQHPIYKNTLLVFKQTKLLIYFFRLIVSI